MTEQRDLAFDPEYLQLINTTDEADVETQRASGERVRTTVWILTDRQHVYVRSERGTRGHWYRDFVARPEGAIHVAGRRVPIRAVPATDPASIALVNDLFRDKYGRRHRASTQVMLQPKTLETTLRLEPI
jgi:hypothetical protein